MNVLNLKSNLIWCIKPWVLKYNFSIIWINYIYWLICRYLFLASCSSRHQILITKLIRSQTCAFSTEVSIMFSFLKVLIRGFAIPIFEMSWSIFNEIFDASIILFHTFRWLVPIRNMDREYSRIFHKDQMWYQFWIPA